jgi:hypothetical protein
MKSRLHSDIKRVYDIFKIVKYAGSVPAKLAVAREYSPWRDFVSLTCNTRPGESMTRLASYTNHNTRPGVWLLATASLSDMSPVLQKNTILKETPTISMQPVINIFYSIN